MMHMREMVKTSDRVLGELATAAPVAHYEIKNHGLLAAQGISCSYEVKRYASAFQFTTKILEQNLLQLSRKPAADLLMTVLFAFRAGRTRNFAGVLVVSSAIGIFGGATEDAVHATHITYGSQVEDRENLTNEVSDKIAYAHELVLPSDILFVAQEKAWDFTATSLAVNEWSSLADLIDVSDRRRG